MRGIQRAGVRLLAGSLLGAGALAALATTAPPPAGSRPAAVVQVASRRPLEVARGAAADGSGQRLSEQSLLDEVGRLNGPVPGREIAGWRAALHAGRVAAPRSAWLHLWLGECALARDAQPEAALAQFREAERLAGPRDAARGAAAYDRAIALYELRAYQEATDAFHRLLVSRDGPRGFDRRRCALWYRQAGVCASYHAERAALGIPEPARLDPGCGAASLAACLRALGRPFDRATVLRACRVTGLGSTAQDLLQACRKLDLVGQAFTADETALKRLPKPLVVHVEHDHFVAVLRADDRGAVYCCSHCGPWPGGQVALTWKQWRAMEPDACVAVSRHGSRADRLLQAVLAPGRRESEGLRLASAGSLTGLHLAGALQMRALVALLKSHVLLLPTPGDVACGVKRASPRQPPYYPTAMDGGCGNGAGPLGTDPVNLATGEEEYTPGPDLTIYNPLGPPVVWRRLYDSLRSPDPTVATNTYQSDDYGVGWSNGYNLLVEAPTSSLDTTTARTLIFANGATLNFTPSGGPPDATNNPTVPCTAAGNPPFQIDWRYDGSSAGYYTVTFTDGTRWVFLTSTPSGDQPVKDLNGSMALYGLARIEDPRHRDPVNGTQVSGLVFTYGDTQASGFRDLDTISDLISGWPLLRIQRDTNGRILAVNDGAITGDPGASGSYAAYWRAAQRSVSYHVGTYPVNPAPGAPTFPELDQVTQVAPPGTLNTPLRYAYGYQMLLTGYLSEQEPFLSSITVPSPTGRGTSTGFINYDTATTFVSSVSDGNGNVRTYASPTPGDLTDTQVRVFSPWHGLAYSHTVGYNGSQELVSDTDGVTDPMSGANTNQVVMISYDMTYAYRPMTVSVPASTSGWLATNYTWGTYGRINAVKTPRGTQTTFTWEATPGNPNFPLGRLMSVQEGTQIATSDQFDTTEKQPTTFAYWDGGAAAWQSMGLLKSITTPAPSGADVTTATTLFSNDNLGNVTEIEAPGDSNPQNPNRLNTVNMSSNSGNIFTDFNYTSDMSDPDGTFMQAEAIGEPLTVTDNLGKVSHFRYSSQGELASARDAVGYKTGYQYSFANQLTTISEPNTGDTGSGNTTTVFSYLYPGGPLKQTDRYDESGTLARRTIALYGAEGELAGEVGSTQPIFYSYDAAYRLVGVGDGNRDGTVYIYNPAGYLDSITYAGGQMVRFPSYDPAGRLKQRIDARNVTSNYAYADPDGLLSQITYPEQTVNLAYDGYDRLHSRSDGAGLEVDSYGDLDEPTGGVTSYAGAAAMSMGYTYWPDGNRQEMTLPTPGGTGSYLYGYEGDGRWNSLCTPFNECHSWHYRDNGWLLNRQLSNGATTEADWSPRGLLTQLITTVGANPPLSQFGGATSGTLMRYDAAGNRRFMPVSIAAASAFSGTSTYMHDFKDQLVQEVTGRNSLPTQWYQYDPAGNAHVFRNQVEEYDVNNTNLADTVDSDGNPTTYKGTAGYQYDSENRLTQAGGALTSMYRGDGLRAWKTSGGVQTFFLYDGALPIVEFTSNGTSNTVTAVNTFGADGLVSRTTGPTNASSVYYTFDPQGNTCQRLDNAGNVLSSHFFDAYGAEYDQPSGTKAGPFGFGAQWGYYTDSETNLVLLTNRYYDPARGRFLTRDPIGTAGGANEYAYVGNSPLSGIDPLGLCDSDAPDADVEAYIGQVQGGYRNFWAGVRGVGRALQAGIEIAAAFFAITLARVGPDELKEVE